MGEGTCYNYTVLSLILYIAVIIKYLSKLFYLPIKISLFEWILYLSECLTPVYIIYTYIFILPFAYS